MTGAVWTDPPPPPKKAIYTYLFEGPQLETFVSQGGYQGPGFYAYQFWIEDGAGNIIAIDHGVVSITDPGLPIWATGYIDYPAKDIPQAGAYAPRATLPKYVRGFDAQ